MGDLLLPTTDEGVLFQVIVVTVVFASVLWMLRRSPDARLLVIGLWLSAYGVIGVRALH